MGMKVKESNDWLRALETMGKILIFTPVIVAVPLILYAVLTGINIGIENSGAGFSAGLMIIAGLITIIYTSIKRFEDRGNGQ